jgi:hypothetical protein
MAIREYEHNPYAAHMDAYENARLRASHVIDRLGLRLGVSEQIVRKYRLHYPSVVKYMEAVATPPTRPCGRCERGGSSGWHECVTAARDLVATRLEAA